LFPCNECAKAIIQSGIKEVVYLSNKYEGTDSVTASMRMFEQAGVSMRKLEIERTNLHLSYLIEE
ncbi:MAG: cytidine deaminase, partial [Sphaerochaetaceae bacterium]